MVSLLFFESRVVRTSVRHWNEGREVTNSLINLQHMAKPRPLLLSDLDRNKNLIQPHLFAPVTNT